MNRWEGAVHWKWRIVKHRQFPSHDLFIIRKSQKQRLDYSGAFQTSTMIPALVIVVLNAQYLFQYPSIAIQNQTVWMLVDGLTSPSSLTLCIGAQLKLVLYPLLAVRQAHNPAKTRQLQPLAWARALNSPLNQEDNNSKCRSQLWYMCIALPPRLVNDGKQPSNQSTIWAQIPPSHLHWDSLSLISILA